jgi:hypothetical protein
MRDEHDNGSGGAAVAAALQRGALVSDRRFDALLPPPLRSVSSVFWTPVGVASVAARWLENFGARAVLDVGAGVGKFCLIGASVTGLRFDGVEHRGHLVDRANELAAQFGVTDRVVFAHARLGAIDFSQYEGLYLYNPFAENVRAADCRLDDEVEMSVERYVAEIRARESIFDQLSVGTLVVTYYGFGGRLPDTFELVRSRFVCDGPLRCWRKTRLAGSGGRWIEDRELLVPAKAEC